MSSISDPVPEPVLPQPLGPPAATTEPSTASGANRARLVVEQEAPTVITQRVSTKEVPHPLAPQSMSDIGESLVGTRLGPFRLDRFVGGGGMGAVFEAVDLELHRTVAVKVLTQRCDESTVRRFRMEAHSAARLNHDNIARVYRVGEDRGWNYIVFEYVWGENVRDRVRRTGPLEVAQALAITAQVALALDHVASRHLVHRDIKPSNILLTPEGRAKVVDMGLARLRFLENDTDDLTASGVTLGTFDYISPEQGRDPRGADVRSDLYSLGCALYFMLTGRPPFPDGTALQKLLRHAGEMPVDPRILRPQLPDVVARILHKLLAKNPADRYQHPRGLIGDLKRAAGVLGLPLGSELVIIPRPRPRISRKLATHLPWMVVCFLLGCAWIGLYYAQLSDGPSLPLIPDMSQVLPPEKPSDTSSGKLSDSSPAR
ncbi:MAG TPA: serine/threonine-protein kinase [Pirellulaceae bacterium]